MRTATHHGRLMKETGWAAESSAYRGKRVGGFAVWAVPDNKATSRGPKRAGTHMSKLASCNAAAVALPARRPSDPRSNALQPAPAARVRALGRQDRLPKVPAMLTAWVVRKISAIQLEDSVCTCFSCLMSGNRG
jgi:hypothetical protein